MQVTYADVAEQALGAAGKTVVEVLLVVSQTGFCVAYIIFVHDTLPNVIPSVSPWAVMAIVVPAQVRLQLRYLSHMWKGTSAFQISITFVAVVSAAQLLASTSL